MEKENMTEAHLELLQLFHLLKVLRDEVAAPTLGREGHGRLEPYVTRNRGGCYLLVTHGGSYMEVEG